MVMTPWLGDEEVIVAAMSSTTSDLPRHRRKIRRCIVSPTAPDVLVGMDLFVQEGPSHKYFKTFRGVWEDKVSWEEIRASKPRYRVRTPSLLLLPLRYLRLPLFRLLFLRMAPSSILCAPLLLGAARIFCHTMVPSLGVSVIMNFVLCLCCLASWGI